MAVKVLLDTDIGSDIDDAVCLAYLLAQPECDLLGITTVTGEGQRRAAMASALCRVAGRDIPILAGAEEPLLIEQKQTRAPQADALDRWTHETQFPRDEAVPFLRRTIRDNPGEVVLLTIGPLTNVGLLFALDPELPSLLKAHVLMAGWFSNRTAATGPLEWNAVGDPHATAVAYRRAAVVHRSVGTDVTCRVRMPAEAVRDRFAKHELLRPVLDFAEVWFRQTSAPVTFHDPLAAALVFDETLCRFQRGVVAVETAGRLQGFTSFREAPDGPHEVAVDVDVGRFFDHYFGVFS